VNTKQTLAPDSCGDEARRLGTIQSDLLRIVGAFGMSRSLLQRRGPWDEASRDPREYEPYRPYAKEQDMIRDVVRSVAKRGNDKERAAVRAAVVQFYDRLTQDALAPLGAGAEAEDVLTLCTDQIRETAEATCAVTTAINSKTPENFDRAARESTEALGAIERLRDVCSARARFFTPRTVKLFQVVR
jgi:hypothetical protein